MTERLFPGTIYGQIATAMYYEGEHGGVESMRRAAEAAERQIYHADEDVRLLARTVLMQYAMSRGIRPELLTDHRKQ